MGGIEAANGRVNLQWFSHKDGFAVLKKESQRDFQAFLAEQRAQYKDAYVHSTEAGSQEETLRELTEAQLGALAEKYDPGKLSEDEYGAFLRDLCQSGVLTQEDQEAVFPPMLTKLDWGAPIVSHIAQTADRPMSRFSDAGGNLLQWAAYRASWMTADSLHPEPYSDRAANVFGRLVPILQKMLEVRADNA